MVHQLAFLRLSSKKKYKIYREEIELIRNQIEKKRNQQTKNKRSTGPG